MQITTVASKDNYEVKLFEFKSPSGRTITSFYQLMKYPGISLGCFDSLEDVLLKLENPELIEANLIEKPSEYFLGERILIGKDELISGVLH
ncbi:hypothetical protein CBP51_03165 [Cellvibrio mixtus]|uniref:Uncharacterized protein n=1 Tax=Cellvibrio mixtus TaxID=39650 RepID=A0A266Q883_9GAMM|nr:hypothetical protein [Cellvibrio mixtus]OZY86045.1 hypothetical protein CBP51_03165 [Cellvibrio mixtus]